MSLWHFLVFNGWVLALALPGHLLLLATVWRYRKKDCFQSAFFKLLFSLTANDTLMCICFSAIVLSLSLGVHHSFPRLTGTLTYTFYQFGYIANVLGLAMIAINRFVNIVCYTRAEMLWTERSTTIAQAVQWSVALLLSVVANLHPDNHGLYLDRNEQPVEAAPSNTIGMGTLIAISMVGFLGTVTIIVCYVACVVKLIYHRATNSMAGGSYQAEIKLFTQGCFLSLFLICSLVTTVVLYIFHCTSQLCLAVGEPLFYISFFASFYTGSLIAFCMCTDLRANVKILFRGANQVGTGVTTQARSRATAHATSRV